MDASIGKNKDCDAVMRVAYLINIYPAVSHSFIRREILALERQGFEVVRISLRGWDDELADEGDKIERAHTRYVLRDGIPALLAAVVRALISRPVRFLRALELTWRMSRRADRPLPVHLAYLAEACRIEPWLRREGIEHLHAHFGTNSAEVAMLVRVLGGPQWSFTAHGTETFDNWQFLGLAEKIRRSAFVVAVSSYGRSQLYRSVGHQSWPKVQLVHCGLEPAFYGEPAIPISTARRLICVGRLSGEKAQLLLIEATRQLAVEGIDFELVLAGDGPMRSELEALIMRYKLQARIRITGWLSSEQVRAEMVDARALVLPSFAEGLPVVLMEAMALGRPVIATFVGGIPELVQSGENGWLVPAGDVEALARAIHDCLNAVPQVLKRMSDLARKQALLRHNIDVEASRLGTLFKEALPELGAAVVK